jgi:hypothetical protein
MILENQDKEMLGRDGKHTKIDRAEKKVQKAINIVGLALPFEISVDN